MPQQPPKRALQFLRWFCREDFLDEVEGDLLEIFELQSKENLSQAKLSFWWQVIRHFRPDYIKAFKPSPMINQDMFKYNFKIAWRSMLKQKLYTAINIGGLSVGLTCFILIFLYMQHEFNYDNFLSNSDRIYRIYQKQAGNFAWGTDNFAVTPAGLANGLKTEYPEVEEATTLSNVKALLNHDQSYFYEEGLWADNHFFDVFSLPFVKGNPQKALSEAGSIVLSISLAKKIFGDKDPMGQSVQLANSKEFSVTGIIEEVPQQSSIQFSFLLPMLSNRQYINNIDKKWQNNAFHTFFTLAPNADPVLLEAKLPIVYDKYIGHDETYPFKDTYFVQSLSDLHLAADINSDIGLKGNAQYISLFILIAIVVLSLGCVNYVNLAIARSTNRIKEVGLRKVIGATQKQLIGQFIGESILISFFALLIALVLANLLAPTFGNLLERPLVLNLFDNPTMLYSLLGLVFIVGVVSGSYPAFIMSLLQPTEAIKRKVRAKFSDMKIQNGLIVFQYATSIILIISSLIIFQQFHFIQSKELGYNKEHVVTSLVRGKEIIQNIKVLKNKLGENPNIISVTTSNSLPTQIESSTLMNRPGTKTKEGQFAIYRTSIDESFLETFDIELVVGRNFSADFSTDYSESYILNESAVQALGWNNQEAIGKQIEHQGGTKTIIGVVKDFHMYSMHLEIEPLLMNLNKDYFNFVSIKIRPENMAETLSFIEENFQANSPYPFNYQFLDDNFEQLHKADLRMGEIFGFFTIVSILIASLGLFGLVAFTAEQRTKEIGIRKVLGASVQSIITLFAKDFLKLVFFGFVIAIPIAWYAMYHWLQDFAYRIHLHWWMFAIGGLFALAIALFTISSQTLKASLANPINSLRNE